MRSLQTILYIFTIKFLIFNQILANELIISHAISMNGIPKYDKNFKNFDYVNNGNEGGKVRLNHVGTFDSLTFRLKRVHNWNEHDTLNTYSRFS